MFDFQFDFVTWNKIRIESLVGFKKIHIEQEI